MTDKIIIKGAKEHNLKDIDLELPRNKLIVFTGISGSGKSSLAFDTIYAEGQRRYVESLSSYARQFLGQMDKPDVEYIEGLSPAISIDQKATSHNPRSTVGTVTEIYDYLRLLFARIGKPHCPKCGREIARQSVDQMAELLNGLPENTRVMLLAPVVRGRKGEYHQLLYDLYRGGFARVRVDGKITGLNEQIVLDRYKQHTIEVVVDRIIIGQVLRSRTIEALETALKLTRGLVIAKVESYPDSHPAAKENKKKHQDTDEILMSANLACPNCNISLGEITPRLFSFNSPFGACPDCHGLGYKREMDPRLVAPNHKLSIWEGALLPMNYTFYNYYGALINSAAEHFGINTHKPIENLTSDELKILLYGPKEPERIKVRYYTSGRPRVFYVYYHGLVPHLEKRYLETDSQMIREEMERYMSTHQCQTCLGARLKPESLLVKVNDKNIAEIAAMAVNDARRFFIDIKLTTREALIAERVLKEVQNRLDFLERVGLEYLTLDRPANTLAGGEAQRIRLASQIGSSLTGVLYVLDEPTIGLHARDNQRLIETLKALRDLGNTVLVVEHDEATIRQADHLVDIGPGAGELGGQVVAQGNIEDLKKSERSITGKYLKGIEKIDVPKIRRQPKQKWLIIEGARENNLKNITVKIPLGLFVGVTGVSGSGKSTLVDDILYKALARHLHGSYELPGKHHQIKGIDQIDKVIIIDQSPIGRTPRSNPATYTKTFDHIRDLFARTLEAKARGYQPGRFSFNVEGGRCANCHGDGLIKIEMHFLPAVYIPCEVCKGQRYNQETLEVRWRGKNIAQILGLTVSEALEIFGDIPQIKDKLQTLDDVGLGYIRLGQSATTLSGGEAQRVKLAAELTKRATGKTLYILDEPTTGLHFADVKKLLEVLNRLVSIGNTVLIIEHNLDVIKSCDWLIDLGPDGGEGGGKIVAKGTPEEVANTTSSYTGQYLEIVLKK